DAGWPANRPRTRRSCSRLPAPGAAPGPAWAARRPRPRSRSPASAGGHHRPGSARRARRPALGRPGSWRSADPGRAAASPPLELLAVLEVVAQVLVVGVRELVVVRPRTRRAPVRALGESDDHHDRLAAVLTLPGSPAVLVDLDVQQRLAGRADDLDEHQT